jgi:hypothetical protein
MPELLKKTTTPPNQYYKYPLTKEDPPDIQTTVVTTLSLTPPFKISLKQHRLIQHHTAQRPALGNQKWNTLIQADFQAQASSRESFT